MHIAIEGMDGVGKTTTGKRLAEELNFKFIEKPLHYLFDPEGVPRNYIRIRNYINEQVDNDALRAWFYGLGNIYLCHRFKGENVVTDRHLVSNYFWCGGKKTEPIYACMLEIIGKPDFTFLLYASRRTGVARLRQRNPKDPDIKKTVLYKRAKSKMEGFMVRYKMKYQAIDTTRLSTEEVVREMLKSLQPML